MIDATGVPAQLLLVAIAFGLSSLIGYERQVRHRSASAGLRTHTLVGLGSALFMLVSKYGFWDVLGDYVTLDPSRIAAQIVSGIGFIGGGLIFVRRDAVRGLTTASVVWVTAAVGAATGAGMVVVALAVTGAHFIVTLGYTPWSHRLSRAQVTMRLRVVYAARSGALRHVLRLLADHGLRVGQVVIDQGDSWAEQEYAGAGDQRGRGQLGRGRDDASREEAAADEAPVSVVLQVSGEHRIPELATELSELDGVLSVSIGESDEDAD